jgi:membrane protease YdiL (CAAX protease family)
MRTPPGRITAIAVGFELGALAIALAASQAVGRPLLPLLRPSVWTSLLAILGTIPLLGILWAVVRSSWPPLRRLVVEVDRHLAPLFADCSTFQLALIAAAAGLGEEALFRGSLLLLADPMGVPAALVATSVVFGLVHLVTPAYAAVAGAIGFYLGWLALWSGGLWLPAAAHALYDFVALSALVHPQSPRRGPDD